MKFTILLLALVILLIGCIEVQENDIRDDPSVICKEQWECSEWSPAECPHSTETQTRTCADLEDCRTQEFKPVETQTCEYTGPCIEDWSCEEWSECEHGQQTRDCADTSNCKTYLEKPKTLQNCDEVCTEFWVCSDWDPCNGKYKERTCDDYHNCGTLFEMPITKELCD